MFKRLLLVLGLASCQQAATTEFTSNPIVATWQDTTQLKHIRGSLAYTIPDSTLYYSSGHIWTPLASNRVLTSGLAAVNTALGTKLNIAGGNMTGALGVQVAGANKHLIAMNLGGSSSSANTTFGPTSYYLGLGHREYGANSFRLIGFGFRYTTNDHYPVVIGYQELNTSSSTNGRFGIWTRSATSNTAPTLRMSVEPGGNVKSYGPITAPEDVTTKGFIDSVPISISTTATPNLATTPSRSITDCTFNGDVVVSLPAAKGGVVYTVTCSTGKKVTIKALANTTIADNVKISAAAGSIVSTPSVGANSITFTGLSSTKWIVTSKIGTWTIQ